ncbi:neuritin-like [Megalops cyprinoides]|uniref:neuritin-like n=1 Tax=Megalops cyprinoides TaxID=118141 RepID=UPI0018647F73|nr:neuritin-like [Megalops cyprinoides]
MGLTTTGTSTSSAIIILVFVVVAGVSAEVKCGSIYKGFSDCVLELGESMANYQEEENTEKGVEVVCSHWEAFHSCATTALAECQEEVGRIWERLKEDSKKIRFQGSLFDLCSPSAAPCLGSSSYSLPLLLLLLALGSPAWLSL